MQLLDFYQSRFGSAVKKQGNGWNGPCPLCGGEPGKSDRFIVWPERTEDGKFSRGPTCIEHNIPGIWWCRGCETGGDTIAYLMKIDGLDFKAALSELGIEGGRPSHRRRQAPAEPRRASATQTWVPREWPEPSEKWIAYAAKLLAEAEEYIWKQPHALRWLAARGIAEEAVRRYHIGYLPAESTKYPGRYRARSALGLAPYIGDDGKEHAKIFIPRGIVIPTFAADGRVFNLRIRRHKEDLTERAPKYMELAGSCKAPLLLRSSRPAPLAAYFVTEAELDAMLIHYVTGGVVGALAVRTNRGKPDAAAHARFCDAVRVCIALDYDAAGAAGVEFWEHTYPTSLRWPTPEGKDPGDAYKLGVNIRDWVSAALPSSISLPSPVPGQTDISLSGLLNVGGGGKPETATPEKGREPTPMRTREDESAAPWAWATEETFTPDELCRLEAALPPYLPLDLVPTDVARAYLLWRGIPAAFKKFRDENGCHGFSWLRDYAWCRKNSARFEALWQFQNRSPALWQWMSDHPESTITDKNLFYIWGKK